MNDNIGERGTSPAKRIDKQRDISVVTDTWDLLWSKDTPWNRIRKQVDQLRSNLHVLISPGDKQFKDVPKRVRLMVVSIGAPLLFAFSKVLLLPQSDSIYLWAIIAVALAAITYIGLIWGLKGQVRKDSFVTVLLLPSLFVLANVLFLGLLFVGELNRVYLWGLFGIALAMFMVLLYIFSLAVNILNVTLFYTIPLSRLGETVAYIFSIITVFLGSYVVAETVLPLLVNHRWVELLLHAGFVLVSTGGLVSAIWRYFVNSSKVFWLSVLGMSVFLTVSLGVFVFSLPYAWLAAIMQSAVAYLLIGFVIHKEQNSFKSPVIIEYAIAILVMFFVAILV